MNKIKNVHFLALAAAAFLLLTSMSDCKKIIKLSFTEECPFSADLNGVTYSSKTDTYRNGRPDSQYRIDFEDNKFSIFMTRVLNSNSGNAVDLYVYTEQDTLFTLNHKYKINTGEDSRGCISYSKEKIRFDFESTDGWIEFTDYDTKGYGNIAYVSGRFEFNAVYRDSLISVTNGTFQNLRTKLHGTQFKDL